MTPTTDRPTARSSSGRAPALPPEERRQAIIAAAGPLVARHGRQVTTRQIAEAACVAEGTLFRVFEDKDELVVATAEDLLDPQRLEVALAAIEPEAPIEELLAEAVRIIQARIADIWQLFGLLGPELRARLARPPLDSDALTALLTPHAARLRTEPRTAARFLRATVMSLAHPMVADTPVPVEDIVDFFCHGAVGPADDLPPTHEENE